MDFLPYTDLPLTHPARAYKSADQTDVAATIAEFREQHEPILVCAVDYQQEQIDGQTEQMPCHHEGADYWMNQDEWV